MVIHNTLYKHHGNNYYHMIIKKNLVKYTNCRVDNDKLKVQSKQLLEEGSDDISNLRHSKKLTRNFAHREFHNKIQ